MKLSVIIPAYNAEKYIERCLDSVAARLKEVDNPEDIEILVVDDGSTDETWKLMRSYKYNKFNIKSFPYGHNGVFWARNQGLLHATGEYITFLDADDEYNFMAFNDYLDAISWSLEDNGEPINIFQFNHKRHYGSTGKTKVRLANEKRWYDRKELPGFWCGVWNKLFRREFLEEHDIRFRQGINYGEDEIFVLDCLKHESGIYCSTDETVTKHIENPSSLGAIAGKDELLNQTDCILDILSNTNDPEYEAMLRRILAEHWSSKTYKRIFGE